MAAGDGAVQKAEVEALKRLVKERWLPLEGSRDEFGIDGAEYIAMAFDHAHDNALDADAAYTRFADAYREHVKRFDPGLKKLVLDTATAIGQAFRGTNRAEEARLAQLRQLLA